MAFHKARANSAGRVELSGIFIDQYMCKAEGAFVKVYLLGLRQIGAEKHLSLAEMAGCLSLLESDVIKAWRYWESVGAVKLTMQKNGEPDIEFQNLEREAYGQKPPLEIKPVYTPDEVYACVSGSRDLQELLTMAERILNKPLSSTDLMVLYSLYDYYRLPMNVIPLLLTYCLQNGKKSMRVIEKVAQDWVDREITTFEKAEEYLKQAETYRSELSQLKKAMGIYDRKFTPTEQKYINEWLHQMHHSVDLIAYAFDISAVNTGKLSVQYMHKILQEWSEKGIKTPAQANEFRKEYKRKAEKPKAAVNGTKFSNFKQPDFDFKSIEDRALGKRKAGE